jgi:putative endopeptidase
MRLALTLILAGLLSNCSSRPATDKPNPGEGSQALGAATAPRSENPSLAAARAPANYIQTEDGYEYVIPEKREFPINPSISPCTNFYEHTCSMELKNFTLRPDRSYHSFTVNDAFERILGKKKAFFKNIDNESFKTEFGPTLRTLYKACMDEPAAKRDELVAITLLRKELSHPYDYDSLLDTLYSLSERGMGSLIDWTDISNLDKPEVIDVIPYAGGTTLPEREYYEDQALLADYEKLVTVFFKSLGMENAEARAHRMVEFETRLGLNMIRPEEKRKRTTERNDISVAKLLELYPQLHLEKMAHRWPKNVTVRNYARESLALLNNEFRKTSLETLKDLALYQTVSNFMDDAYPDFIQAKIDFTHRHLGGPEKRSARAERCVRHISKSFSREIDAEMVTRLFPNFPSDRFLKLSERIRGAIIKGLKANTWLHPDARAMAIKKITKAKLMLIQPTRKEDWGFNPKATFIPDGHTSNKLSLAAALAKKADRQLRKPRNRSEWLMSPLEINAYYMPPDNTFVMPIGYLQPPFFDAARTDEENIATIGETMGHELGHGIDDQGSKYDDQGRVTNWLGDEDLAEFRRRSSSLVEQFDKAGHNGKLTLGENIGDLVGLTFSYDAAFPGGTGSIELKKKFFYAFAQAECFTANPKLIESILKEDPHAIGWTRVNEQVKHQPGFAEAFSCKPGDPMTLPPEQRVRIW